MGSAVPADDPLATISRAWAMCLDASPFAEVSSHGFVGFLVHHPGRRPRCRSGTSRFANTRRPRTTLDPHRDRRPDRQHRARVWTLVNNDAIGPAQRSQRQPVRIGSHCDQADAMEHLARGVPAQADHAWNHYPPHCAASRAHRDRRDARSTSAAADSGPPAGCRGRRGCHESARQALTATCTEGPPGTGTRKLRLTSALTSLEDQFSWAGSRAE